VAALTEQPKWVPAEFRGAARVLHRRLCETDNLVEVTLRAMRPLKERLARHPFRPLRQETLVDAKRTWLKEMPAFGSLARFCKIEDRWQPKFYELHLGASRFGREDWVVPTDGVLVILIGATVRHGYLSLRAVILATVSMHALGRRYERGRRDEASVFDDLSTLAFRYPDLIETTDSWNCPAGDGTWTGYAVRAGDDAALNVTTFLADNMTPPAAGQVGDLEKLIGAMPALRFHEPGAVA
jgi:hypothetical protein